MHGPRNRASARGFFGSVILAFTLVAPLPAEEAQAGEERSPARAEDHFREGDRLAKKKEYREALDHWTRGYLKRLPRYRGLEFLRPVSVQYMVREKLREYLVGVFRKEYPEAKLEVDRLAYSRFGFFDRDLDLRKILLDLLTEEIAGFYDPETKKLFLIEEKEKSAKDRGFWEKLFGSGNSFDPDEQKALLAHEMSHALADQHFDLLSMTRSVEEDDDMALAYAAVVEGEAMLVMMLDLMGDGAGGGREALQAVSRGAGSFMSEMMSMAIVLLSGKSFRRAPLICREGLLFPYMKGMRFCGSLTREGTWDLLDEAFRAPPLSTEQILHPEKYLKNTRDDPVALAFGQPAPLDEKTWELVKKNSLGEFGIEVLLRPRLGKGRSAAAAAGWDGDLYHLYREKSETDDRSFLIWVSTWDSEEDAREFAGALGKYLARSRGGDRQGDEASWKPVGFPALAEFWKDSDDGLAVSGIWRKGVDVWHAGGVPRQHLEKLALWSLHLRRAPKKH